jgi:hypothetical protein
LHVDVEALCELIKRRCGERTLPLGEATICVVEPVALEGGEDKKEEATV